MVVNKLELENVYGSAWLAFQSRMVGSEKEEQLGGATKEAGPAGEPAKNLATSIAKPHVPTCIPVQGSGLLWVSGVLCRKARRWQSFGAVKLFSKQSREDCRRGGKWGIGGCCWR
jgi:hypothetical protein